MKIDEYVAKVEKKILKKGHSISTWYSSERKRSVGGAKADLLVRGNMAVKGVLLSRMWAWTAPAWETLAVVFSERGDEKVSLERLTKLVSCTEKYMSTNDIKWSWLVCVSEKGFDDETVSFTKSRLKKEIGIMLVDPATKGFVCNNVLVNKYGARIFKP